LRQQRDALRKEAEVAKEEATEARKRATKAEGRLKGARTKARNLRETPFVAHADRDAHAEKLRKAEAAIERAEGPAEQAKAAQKAAHEHAQQLDERSRAATRAVFDFRSAEQAKTEVVKQEQAKQTAAVKQGTEQRRRFEARAIVDEKGRPIGGKRGGAIGSSPLHEIIDLETGRRAQGTGEYTRAENARRRAADLSKAAERAAEETAEVVEKTEDRQTTAVEKGTARRKKARAEEGKAIGGNTAEFSRKISEHADLLASELTPEQRVDVAKQIQKTQPAQQARAAKKLTEAVERQVTAPADENERLRQAVAEEIRATQTHAAAKREADAISRQADKLAPEEIARRRESLAASNARLASAKADLTAAEAELVAKRELAAAERLAARQISASGLAHQQVPPYLRARQSLQPVTTPLPWWMDARVRAAQESQLRRRLLTEGVSHTARGTLSPDEVARRRELRESGGIGRYPPPPPPPPRPPAPPAPPEPPEPPRRPPIIYNEELAARAAEGQATYASRVRDSETALRRWSAQLGIADQSMRKHGTFTTEFIDAARKGDVAYREWGWQIGAAAAKFGAWTAAGAGIYAAIGAVQKVGQGALDSASGVPMLRRTIPGADSGQAQRQFRQLSTDFAVPISDAADAMMRMGAVFKTQEGAFIGARTALMAYRTGEVDVATATQQLTQIQTGMGASAQDLADIFDRLNYVQNNYGARIPDLLDGTSKLSAAWRQAGGDADYLVAIITAMNRTAGASGAQAATILGRTIGNIATALVRRHA
jgi:hypothetical protein